MKYLYIYIFVFFGIDSYSQNYDYIKKLDTIYIPFRKEEFNIKINYPTEKDGFKNCRYIFNYKKEGENTFSFEFKKKPSKIVETKNISKKIFKKNASKIIEIDSLKAYDYQDVACDLFNQFKIIYIIDFSEKKGRDFKMYRVISMNLCYAIE